MSNTILILQALKAQREKQRKEAHRAHKQRQQKQKQRQHRKQQYQQRQRPKAIQLRVIHSPPTTIQHGTQTQPQQLSIQAATQTQYPPVTSQTAQLELEEPDIKHTSYRDVKYNALVRQELNEQAVHKIACPHCQGGIEVSINQVNCQIFRHGTLKNTGQPMNPHTPKEECDRLFAKGLIWGCGKPFKFTGTGPPVILEQYI